MRTYLRRKLLKTIKSLADKLDHEVQPRWHERRSHDVSDRHLEIVNSVREQTMTSFQRVISLVKAAEHVIERAIPGPIVECGVWRGGSMMAVAKTLMLHGRTDKDLYLFDTYDGMPEPTPQDGAAVTRYEEKKEQGVENEWCYADVETVRDNLYSTGYPRDKIHFIKGRVEQTIPQAAPESISLLRLDTDWYESSMHELVHLYPRLETGGIILLDDYGHWEGCKRAVDEYIQKHNLPLFLARIDYTGRIGVKAA